MLLKNGQKVRIKSIDKTGEIFHRILGENIYEVTLNDPIVENEEVYDLFTTSIDDLELIS